MSAIGALDAEWREQKRREVELLETFEKKALAATRARQAESDASRALFGCRDQIQRLEAALDALGAEVPKLVES